MSQAIKFKKEAARPCCFRVSLSLYLKSKTMLVCEFILDGA